MKMRLYYIIVRKREECDQNKGFTLFSVTATKNIDFCLE